MKQTFIRYIHSLFNKLIEVYGVKMKSELNDGQSYMIEYSSKDFVLRIEKYFREFYALLYKANDPDEKINLFNLLEYIIENDSEVPRSEYFRNEKDVEECYKKQLNHIFIVFYQNYYLIDDFFNDKRYQLNIREFEKFWRNKHPELYPR